MAEPEQKSHLAFWAYSAAFLGVFGHATSEFFSVYSGLKGPEVSVWRFTIGGAALLVVALIQKESRNLLQPVFEEPFLVIPLAVFGMSMAQLVFHWSLDFASVVQVATIVTTMPILVVVVDRIINKSPVSAPKIVSGIGAFIGVIFLLTDGYLDQLELGGNSLIGIALALCCAVVGAFYLVLVRPLIQEYGAVRMTALTFIIGAFALWTTVHLVWEITVNPLTLFERPPQAYWSILALGIWNTCIGFILWLWGISN
ncbi:MAG: DMT family transporter, partial [SAR324 cluster bacterium]|nr:DMT family transporter [SAR324 cluster bacterium]